MRLLIKMRNLKNQPGHPARWALNIDLKQLRTVPTGEARKILRYIITKAYECGRQDIARDTIDFLEEREF